MAMIGRRGQLSRLFHPRIGGRRIHCFLTLSSTRLGNQAHALSCTQPSSLVTMQWNMLLKSTIE